MKNEKGIIIPILLGLFVIGGFLFILLAPFTIIGTGNVGVLSVMGKVNDEPLYAGFHLVSPLSDVDSLSMQVQRHEGEFNAASKDMQHVKVNMIVNYHLDGKATPKLFKEVGLAYVEKIISPAASETLKAEIALHNASEILEKRSMIRAAVQKSLRAWVEKYGVLIDEMSFVDISFSEEYEKAIETKQLEEQKAEQKKYELIQAQRQAEIVAAKAKGDADSRVIAANAEAEYNRKVAESITPELLKLKYYEAWNGVLPTTMLGENTSILLGAPGK